MSLGFNLSAVHSCIPSRDVLRGLRWTSIDWSAEERFRRLLAREVRFAGLHALSNLARARWALDFAIARLAAGGPLSTRLDFPGAR